MRVLMLSWEYPPHFVGGLGRHVTELAPLLAAEGVQVHILTPMLNGGQPYQRISEHLTVSRARVPSADHSGFVAYVRQVNETLIDEAHKLVPRYGPFDLLHAHDWLVAYTAITLKHAWDQPLLATIHATERGRNRGTLRDSQQHAIDEMERRLAQESWRLITVSHFMSNQVHEFFQIPSDKIDVLYNAVQMLSNRMSPKERHLLRSQYAAEHQKIVFSIGRLVYEKGFHVLLEAIPHVLTAQPRTQFIIAGTGELRQSLEQRSYELDIANHVSFVGFISDPERDRLYQAADVAVFPSLYEPFGIVALEAMAAYCPVVVSQTGGLQEVVHPHETGITVYPDDPDSLTWGILHTLQNPKWAALRAENAFRLVTNQFAWQHIARQTRQVYQRILDEWHHSIRGT